MALDEESAFQVAGQTLQVIYPPLKYLIVFPQHYYLFIYFFPGFSIVNITFHPVPLGRIRIIYIAMTELVLMKGYLVCFDTYKCRFIS